MLISEINSFFQSHPLKEHYFNVNESERAGTAAVAERDVMAAISHCTVSTDEERGFLNAAIAEQTIFLIQLGAVFADHALTSLSLLLHITTLLLQLQTVYIHATEKSIFFPVFFPGRSAKTSYFLNFRTLVL